MVHVQRRRQAVSPRHRPRDARQFDDLFVIFIMIWFLVESGLHVCALLLLLLIPLLSLLLLLLLFNFYF
jgi:hypothetical protein